MRMLLLNPPKDDSKPEGFGILDCLLENSISVETSMGQRATTDDHVPEPQNAALMLPMMATICGFSQK